MRFRNDGGLDMRFKGAKTQQALLIMLGVIGLIIAAIIYFIYTYLFIILPIVMIVFQFKYFKTIKTKFKLYFALSSLSAYIITLSTLVYLNSTEPVSIYGSYSNDDIKLKIFKNKNFQDNQENKISDKEYDDDLVSRCRNLIKFANNSPELPIIEFTKRDKSDYKEYAYYGFIHKKESGIYETTLEKIYDKYDKSYVFTNGNPSHDLKFFIENYTWFASFKGINFGAGSIIAIRFIILAGLIAIIATYFSYNYFQKSRKIFKEQEEIDSTE